MAATPCPSGHTLHHAALCPDQLRYAGDPQTRCLSEIVLLTRGGPDGSQRHRAYFSDRVEFRTLARILPKTAAVSWAEAGDRQRHKLLLRRRAHRGRDQRAGLRACRSCVRAKPHRPAPSLLCARERAAGDELPGFLCSLAVPTLPAPR